MARLSVDVIQQLLDEMNRLVVTYPERVERTGRTLDELIAGTAFFPGGTGLWRGRISGGPLPVQFPEKPVMFVAHNFGNLASLQEAIREKGEAHSAFANLWANLLDFFGHASPLDPAESFFTNALMGLKPDDRSGKMPSCEAYESQCLHFLSRQTQIVDPKAIVILGGDAATFWRRAKRQYPFLRAIPSVEIMHPSARPLNQKPTPALWKQNQGSAILGLLQ
jgi:hypothetical protein